MRRWLRHRSVKARLFFWSIRNRLKGFMFGPVQRFRCCQHTTPYHYRWCPFRQAIDDVIDRSSLGTSEAKALRARTPERVVCEVMRRVREMARKENSTRD